MNRSKLSGIIPSLSNKKLILGFVIAILIFVSVFVLLRGNEDSWIKDSRGVYVKHGNPSQTPSYVLEQQTAVYNALKLYQEYKLGGIPLNSQCLGTIESYAVDIVYVPRITEDNLPQNQCADFLNEKVKHFIELDKDGEIVRVG